jgi:hypothetical protein
VFLIQGNGPEQQELARLIGTLVDEGADTHQASFAPPKGRRRERQFRIGLLLLRPADHKQQGKLGGFAASQGHYFIRVVRADTPERGANRLCQDIRAERLSK